MSNSMLIPSIQGSPGGIQKRDSAQAPEIKDLKENGSSVSKEISDKSFHQILGNQLQPIVEPLKFSAHASARLKSRNVQMNAEQMKNLNSAVEKAASKGLDDTLVITKDGAFIVNVGNRTVVTAMDREMVDGSVFTNIDGAVFA